MPAAIQPKFGQKIMHKILGKPNTLQTKESELGKKMRKVLLYQSARLIR